MKDHTVIFIANPNTKGHCAHILKNCVTQLSKQKRNFTVIDLYKEKYDPIMHKNEQYTNGGYDVSKQTQKYRDLIKKSSHVIFIHPVWWNSMPAMLKGFFDKVFGSRFAFIYKKYPIIPFPVPIGLLKGKRSIVFTTTGAQWWMSLLIQHNRFQAILVDDILRYCGMKSKSFVLHSCGKDCESRVSEIEKLVAKGLKWLF